MKLTKLTINEFADELASDSPAPGGGSTAALEGALGVSLISMVAKLTIGNKNFKDSIEVMKQLSNDAEKLRDELIEIIDKDTEAFNEVSKVFAMAKMTDEDKALRKEAMQKALKACTLTPFEMMRCSLEGLKLAEKTFENYNTNAASDLGVAVLSLKAAVQGAWLNILINIGGIKDEAFVAQYRQDGQRILKESNALADQLFNTIENSL